jgi:hypothetical protein
MSLSENFAEKNNYITNLEDRTERDRVPEGCGAHIVHSCVNSGCYTTPVEAELRAVKILVHKYLHIASASVAEL